MKLSKKILTVLCLGTLSATSLQADCRDVVFGPPSKGNIATSYSAYYTVSPRVFYDENKKIQIREFGDAYVKFFKNMVNTFEKDCKEGKGYLNPVNVTISQSVDKDNFYFTATTNFEIKK